MISNLKYDIEFRREKALELSSQVEQHLAAAGAFLDRSPLRSIHHHRSAQRRSIPAPSLSVGALPFPWLSARRCGNSRRHYEQAEAQQRLRPR